MQGLFVPDKQNVVSIDTTHHTGRGGTRGRHSKICTAVYSVPYGNEGCMVDALAKKSDEGRVMAAISFGEVPNNL